MGAPRQRAGVVVGALLVLLAVPASSVAVDEAEARGLTIEPGRVPQGGSFTISGVCPQGAGGQELAVVGAWDGRPQIDRVQAADDGSFSDEVTMLDDAPAGEQEVAVECGVRGILVAGTVTITEVPVGHVDAGFGGAVGSAGALAGLAAGLGLLLLVVGLLLGRGRGRA